MITLKPQQSNLLLLVIIFILISLQFKSCSAHINAEDRNEANMWALTSKTETYKTKAKELSYKNASFIASEKELKKLND